MYISPNLSIFQNFDDLKKEKTYGNYKWYHDDEKFEVKDILLHDRFIILGEPGFGKTELLKKILETSNTQNFNSIFIDLKNLDLSTSIVDNIARLENRPDTIKTSKFHFQNNENVIVCFDALDEVTGSNISSVIDKIKDFIVNHEKVKIYLSCRRLYFENYQNSLNGYNFKFLLIECFIQEQIVRYLKENKLEDSEIDAVLKNFMQNSGSISVIQTPRYLSLLVSYISEKGISEIDKLTRCQLFEYFIYNKLNKEKKVLKKVDIDLIKRVLETLALTMSIYQVRKITKDELMTFFDDIKNDLKINILSQITIDEFLEKSILKNNIDNIEFDNSEFQEYLAAKELSRFKKLQQSVFDLAVNVQIREVYPSWFNVLSYLIEINITLLDDILSFGMRSQKTIVEGYFKLITGVNTNLLNNATRDKIFKEVFEYYQNNKISLHGNFSKNLSYYYTSSNLNILKKYLDNSNTSNYKKFIYVRNVFNILYEILERGYLPTIEIKYWNDRFISILEDKSVSMELKKQILFISQHLNDRRILVLLQEFSLNADKDFLQSILSYSANIDINSSIMLDLILEGIKKNIGMSTYYLIRITSNDILKTFFKRLNSDIHLIVKFHDLLGSEKEKYIIEFVNKNIKLDDQELVDNIKQFIFSSYNQKVHLRHNSKIVKSLAELISDYDKNFIFELIDKFNETKGDYFEFQLSEIFSYCISKNQIARFIEEVRRKLPKPTWLAFETLYRLKHSKEVRYIELFEEGKKYFIKDYEEADANSLKYKNRDEEIKKEEYETFNTILNVSNENRYYPRIFSYYTTQHEVIEQFINEQEREKLKKLNLKFLTDHNPLNSGLVFKTENQFSVYDYILDYGEAVECAKLLGLDIANCRQNIINFIPFAYSYQLDAVFSLVGYIPSNELEPVIDVYRRKTDDLWRFMPENLLELIERFNFKGAETILEDFVISSAFRSSSDFYRLKALNLLNSIKKNKQYLKDIFDKYLNTDKEKFISLESNKILISEYQDVDALNWRVNEIYKRVFPLVSTNSGRVSSEESEIRDKSFASPLMEVNDITFLEIYLKLYRDSFVVQGKGSQYWSYANYMREIVLAYFFNLRKYKNFQYFEIIESECKKYEKVDHFGYILSAISNLKYQYIDYIGKPTNISECVFKYNKIKNNQYIEITNCRELIDKVNLLIKTDLNIWIQGEGIKILEAVKSKNRPGETELQKLIKMQFENILLRNGFRSEEINIYREVQALNDKRPDYILAYGFVTPIVIELKLSDHDDLNKKELSEGDSYKSLIFYLNNFNVGYAIFLVYDNQNLSHDKWSSLIKKIEFEYSKIPNVVILGLPQNTI